MFTLLARWFRRGPADRRAADGSLTIPRWRLETPIRLKEAIQSKTGANASVIGVLVDVRYVVEGTTPVVRGVAMSANGSNVFSRRTDEAWHVPPTRIPAGLVAEAVEKEVAAKSSKLAVKMLTQWKNEGGREGAAT